MADFTVLVGVTWDNYQEECLVFAYTVVCTLGSYEVVKSRKHSTSQVKTSIPRAVSVCRSTMERHNPSLLLLQQAFIKGMMFLYTSYEASKTVAHTPGLDGKPFQISLTELG